MRLSAAADSDLQDHRTGFIVVCLIVMSDRRTSSKCLIEMPHRSESSQYLVAVPLIGVPLRSAKSRCLIGVLQHRTSPQAQWEDKRWFVSSKTDESTLSVVNRPVWRSISRWNAFHCSNGQSAICWWKLILVLSAFRNVNTSHTFVLIGRFTTNV